MFINPKTVIEEGWITHPDCSVMQDWEDKKFISPNAIDFTLDAVHPVNQDTEFVISEKGKKHRGCTKLAPTNDIQSGDDYWTLTGQIYDGTSDMFVNVPDGIVSWLIPRSSLTRNGLFLMSGIYDSCFSGSIGFVMYNLGGRTKMGVGTRVGQIIFAESDNAKKYEGGYNTQAGQHWNTADPRVPVSK
jgi:deoxycytidine triphosphate deaminase